MRQLSIFDWDITGSRHGGNRQSIQANIKVTPYKESSKMKILELMFDRESSNRGTTLQDACSVLDKHPNQISGRFTELKALDIIGETDADENGFMVYRLVCFWSLKDMSNRIKQHSKWDRELTKALEEIDWCEKCGRTDMHLEKAHRVKRRFIGWESDLDRLEYFMSVKLCRPCHQGLDEATGDHTHKRMFEAVTSLIKSRWVNISTPMHPVTDWDEFQKNIYL